MFPLIIIAAVAALAFGASKKKSSSCYDDNMSEPEKRLFDARLAEVIAETAGLTGTTDPALVVASAARHKGYAAECQAKGHPKAAQCLMDAGNEYIAKAQSMMPGTGQLPQLGQPMTGSTGAFPPCELDATIQEPIKSMVLQLLSQATVITDAGQANVAATAMESLAITAETTGYVKAAQCLRNYAAILRSKFPFYAVPSSALSGAALNIISLPKGK